MSRDLIVGIDGGATRSRLLALTEDGEVAVRREGQGVSLTALSLQENLARISGLIAGAGSDGDIVERIRSLAIGIPGAWSDSLRRSIEGEASRLFLRGESSTPCVFPDCTVALAGGIPDGPGVLAIAGTGCSVVARDVQGEVALYGGWGHLIGDDGGAFAVGREALRYCSVHEDGLGERPAFHDAILKILSERSLRSALPVLYDDNSKSRIAALAPVVDAFAQEGEPLAESILRRAAAELGLRIVIAVRFAGADGVGECVCAVTGGLWESSSLYRRFLRESTRNRGVRSDLQSPHLPAVVGACLIAGRAVDLDFGECPGYAKLAENVGYIPFDGRDSDAK